MSDIYVEQLPDVMDRNREGAVDSACDAISLRRGSEGNR